MKTVYVLVFLTLLTACAQPVKPQSSLSLSASEIIAQAKADEWQTVSADNILKVTLPTGVAYIALNPQLAPKHTVQIKKLAREGFYQNTNIYRFVEGFVAQGGDSSANKEIKTASKNVPAEFYLTTAKPLSITELQGDGYAPVTGFLNGFAVAQNKTHTQTWQVHCSGVFAMARDTDINSASTEFFVTIGQGPRYLDKNITVFGRVLEGMAHFNLLQRQPVAGTPFNPITNIQVLSDIADDNSEFEILSSNSASFKALIAARKNRRQAWFVHAHNYIDVCAVPIPTRRVNKPI